LISLVVELGFKRTAIVIEEEGYKARIFEFRDSRKLESQEVKQV